MKSQRLTTQAFPTPSWVRRWLDPLVGTTMLELGNKTKGKMVYKDVFESLGFGHVSVDLNGKNGALALDLRKPLNLGTFDMVTNIGTSEHVSVNDYAGQAGCWRNIVEAMHVGSVLVSITPRVGVEKWKRHGRWYPTTEFFEGLAKLNGMTVERLEMDDNEQYARLRRTVIVDFEMPGFGLYANPDPINKRTNAFG